MLISLVVLGAVFVLIAIRRIGQLQIQIWQSMFAGALVLLLSGEIGWIDALEAIDLNVMIFLFAMFIVGQALVDSGYLYYLAYKLFGRINSVSHLVLGVLFGAALASALLMNDTLAIIGTPLVLRLSREHKINSQLLLLTLAYAITIGSVMSPIGNPQNLLIASVGGLASPFTVFFKALVVPTLINLLIAYLFLFRFYRSEFINATPLVHGPVAVLDEYLAKLARISVVLLLCLISVNIFLAHVQTTWHLELAHIALLAAIPILLFSPDRLAFLRKLDWSTLLFFASMFVLTASVWQSGAIQQLLMRIPLDLTDVPVIMGISAALSQLISNVPLVALYLPVLGDLNSSQLMALAAGSTIAGNCLILGAASNVIIVQHAEKHNATLGFFEFARIGIPLSLLNLLVYWLWFRYGFN